MFIYIFNFVAIILLIASINLLIHYLHTIYTFNEEEVSCVDYGLELNLEPVLNC